MDQAEYQQLGEDLTEALQKVLNKYGGEHSATRGVLVKFIVAAEMLGDDGKTWFITGSSPRTPSWQVLGLLDAAKEQGIAMFHNGG